MEESKGFLKIIELFIEKKVPLIGHNCYADLLFIYDKFIGQIPEYEQFKNQLNNLFPSVYDTKYISNEILSQEKLDSTSLEYLKSFFWDRKEWAHLLPNIKLAENFEKYDFTNPQNA